MKRNKTTQEVFFEASSNLVKLVVAIIIACLVAYPLVWLTVQLNLPERVFRVLASFPILCGAFLTLKYQLGEKIVSVVFPTVKVIGRSGEIIYVETNPTIATRNIHNLHVEVRSEIELWDEQARRLITNLRSTAQDIQDAFYERRQIIEESLKWVQSTSGASVTRYDVAQRMSRLSLLFRIINDSQSQLNVTHSELGKLIKRLNQERWNEVFNSLHAIEELMVPSWYSQFIVMREHRLLRKQYDAHEHEKQQIQRWVERPFARSKYESMWKHDQHLIDQLDNKVIQCIDGQLYRYNFLSAPTVESIVEPGDVDALL